MRSGTALALMLSLAAAPHPAAAQEPVADPIARAIRHEAARLAAQPTDASASAANQSDSDALSDWSRVRNLRPGTALLVTVNSERRPRRFVSADDVQLIVRDAEHREETIARGDVTRVALTSIRGSVPAAAAAATLGALVGIGLAINLGTEVRCQPHCGGVEAMMWASAIGIPVGVGFGGYYAFGRTTIDVIYRAPSTAALRSSVSAAPVSPRSRLTQ
jgi:hypothetical protein